MTFEKSSSELRKIWRQNSIPVVVKQPDTHKLFVKLPTSLVNLISKSRDRLWLRQISPRGRIPKWEDQYGAWEVPKSWLTDLVRFILERFGECYIVQEFREAKKCAPSCMNAKGLDCDCACKGENHGIGGPNSEWFVVSETFAISWGDKQMGCRHMKAP